MCFKLRHPAFPLGMFLCPQTKIFAESLPFQKHISLWYQYQFRKGANQSNSSLFTSTGEGLE